MGWSNRATSAASYASVHCLSSIDGRTWGTTPIQPRQSLAAASHAGVAWQHCLQTDARPFEWLA